MKKLILMFFFITANISIAQHEYDSDSDDSMNLLFGTQQLDFSAEVLSDSEKLVTGKKFVLYLNLTTAFTIDFATVKLNLNSSNGKVKKIYNFKKISSGSYKTSVLLKDTGSYWFNFSFILKDSTEIPNQVNFSFNEEVLKTKKENIHKSGFMGMSTTMMIIMGAAMIIMMGIILVTGGGH